MDALRTDLPPAPPRAFYPAMQPWWTPCGGIPGGPLPLCGKVPDGRPMRVARRSIPHREREAAVAARELLRELGVPFVVRAHAAALLANLPKTTSLLRADASEETYRRLACSLDLRRSAGCGGPSWPYGACPLTRSRPSGWRRSSGASRTWASTALRPRRRSGRRRRGRSVTRTRASGTAR